MKILVSLETKKSLELAEKIKVLSVSKLFAEAIRRVHHDESISVLFS